MSLPYELIVKEDFEFGRGSKTVTMPGGGTASGTKVGIHTWIDTAIALRDIDGLTLAARLSAASSALSGTGFVFDDVFSPALYLLTPANSTPALSIGSDSPSSFVQIVHGRTEAKASGAAKAFEADTRILDGDGGQFVGVEGHAFQPEGSTHDPSGSQFFGGSFEASIRTASTSEATVMGVNIQARLLDGASGFGEITGGEVDVVSEEEPTYRCAWLLSAVPSADNPTLQNFGATGAVDCAIGIGSKNFGAKFRDGIFIFQGGLQFPIQTSGSLIRAVADSQTDIHAGLNLQDSGNVRYTYPIIVPGMRILFTAGATWQMSLGANADPTGGASLDLNGTDGALLVNRLTTAERDALGGPVNGMIIYNTTTAKFQGYEAGAWANLI